MFSSVRELGYRVPQITGMRFKEIPECPHLKGYTPLGMWPRELIWGRDGLRQSLAEATKMARQHERGVAYFYEGATTYVVLTKPQDIDTLLKATGAAERGGVHPHLKTGMGNAIFFAGARDQNGFASGPNRGNRKMLWQAKALDPEQRAKFVPNMEEHADTTVASLRRLHDEKAATTPALETLFAQHALGVLGDNLMGIKNLEGVLERWHRLSKPLLRTTTSARIPALGALKDKCKGQTPEKLNKAYFEFVQEALLAEVPEVKDHEMAKQNLLQAIIEQHRQEAAELAAVQARENVKAAHAKEAKALAASSGESESAVMTEILKKQDVIEEIDREKQRIVADNLSTTQEGILADAGFLLFSGHDTTAQSLTTNIKLLAAHPDVVATVRRTIFKNCYDPKTGTLDLSFDKLNPREMGLRQQTNVTPDSIFYLHMIMDETQRLFPPIPWLERVMTHDMELPDPNRKGQVLKLKKGDKVLMDSMSLHRTPEFYAKHGNPEDFKGDERDLNKYSPFRGNIDYRFNTLFLNFGQGPTMCPGFLFALQEMKILLARLIMAFDFEEVGENSFDFTVNDFVLKFKNPTHINFVPRDVVKEQLLLLEREQQQKLQSAAPAEAKHSDDAASSAADKAEPVRAADATKAAAQVRRRSPFSASM